MNTRTITDAINNIKAELLLYDVVLNYKNLKFTDFRSWTIKTTIEDFVIKSNNLSAEANFGNINIVSDPYNRNIKILFDNKIRIVLPGQDTTLVYKYDNTPVLNLDFIKSLSAFVDDDFNILQNISNATLKFGSWSSYNDTIAPNQEAITYCENSEIKLSNDIDKKILLFIYSLKNRIHNSQLKDISNTTKQQLEKQLVSIGKVNSNVIVDIKYPDTVKAKKPQIWEINCKMDQSNQLFIAKLAAKIQTYPYKKLPNISLNFNIKNFAEFYQYYKILIKAYFYKKNSPQFRFKFSDTQEAATLKMLEEREIIKDNSLQLEVENNKKEFLINKKDGKEFINRFYYLLQSLPNNKY